MCGCYKEGPDVKIFVKLIFVTIELGLNYEVGSVRLYLGPLTDATAKSCCQL